MTLSEILKTKDIAIEFKFFVALLKRLKAEHITQANLAMDLGVSAPLLSGWINSTETIKGSWQVNSEKLIRKYNVQLDSYSPEEDVIYGFRMGKGQAVLTTAIGIPKVFLDNKIWLVYSDLLGKIGIRTLIVRDDGMVEYLVKSKLHGDYEGTYMVNSDRPGLTLDLCTKKSNKKDLRIYLWLHDIESTPSVLAGVLTYYRIEGGVDSHKILMTPAKFGKHVVEEKATEEFAKENPSVAKYFHMIRPTRLYSTPDIWDELTLDEYITRKCDEMTTMKMELYRKISNINNVEDLKRLSTIINNNIRS